MPQISIVYIFKTAAATTTTTTTVDRNEKVNLNSRILKNGKPQRVCMFVHASMSAPKLFEHTHKYQTHAENFSICMYYIHIYSSIYSSLCMYVFLHVILNNCGKGA